MHCKLSSFTFFHLIFIHLPLPACSWVWDVFVFCSLIERALGFVNVHCIKIRIILLQSYVEDCFCSSKFQALKLELCCIWPRDEWCLMHVVQKKLEEVEWLFYRLDYFNCLTIIFMIQDKLTILIYQKEMLEVLNLLPKNGYQDNVKLIYWKWSKQLIKRNVMGTNE